MKQSLMAFPVAPPKRQPATLRCRVADDLFRSAIAWLIAIACVVSSNTPANAQAPGLIEFSLGGQLRKGLELINFGKEAIIIGRDGSLHSIDPSNQREYKGRIEGRYSPMSAQELRNELRKEYGRAYEVVATKHFLVVQPKGRGKQWPNLFETSHRTFITYMRNRGVRVRQGRFPMVAVVFPDSREMYREFAKLDLNLSRVAGVYVNNTNRVITHDGGSTGHSVATIRHEAAHQSGFNSGVHSRVNDTPRWVTEGIGQLFEPAAMGNAGAGTSVQHRVNRESLYQLNQSYASKNASAFSRDLKTLVAGDRMFDGEPSIGNAYAIAWSMMFYLAERNPKAFARLLNHTAARPAFRTYERDERVKDFERIVGCDCYEFSRRVSKFVKSFE